MITIPVQSIRKFKQKASKISTNKILRICGYILFNCKDGICKLTKTSTDAFVTEEFDAEGNDNFLVDEKTLFDMADNSTGTFLTIKDVKLVTHITDGILSIESGSDDYKLFPSIPIPEKENKIISPELVRHLKIAVTYLLDEGEIKTARSFVFVGKGYVASSDSSVAYFGKTEFEGQLILRKGVINSLVDSGANYFKNSNYDFFEMGTSMYGFIKSDFSFFDLTKFLEFKKDDNFSINTEDLKKFNGLCVLSSFNKFIIAIWEFDDKMKITSTEDVYNKKIKRDFDVKGEGKFSYNPEKMNKILNHITTEESTFYKGNGNYYITDANNSFVSIIQQCLYEPAN